MKKNDKLVCLKTTYNFLGNPLFIKNNIYIILDIDDDIILLNHILYGNEYVYHTKDMLENFISLKEYRKLKLKKLL